MALDWTDREAVAKAALPTFGDRSATESGPGISRGTHMPPVRANKAAADLVRRSRVARAWEAKVQPALTGLPSTTPSEQLVALVWRELPDCIEDWIVKWTWDHAWKLIIQSVPDDCPLPDAQTE